MRDLKNNLSRYLDQVARGDEVIVTLHGKPVARLSQIDRETDRLAELVAEGLARPPVTAERRLPTLVKAVGTVSDLVAEQRR